MMPSGTGDAGFLVVATDTAHRHVESLLRRGIEDAGADCCATVGDVTGAFAQSSCYVRFLDVHVKEIGQQRYPLGR